MKLRSLELKDSAFRLLCKGKQREKSDIGIVEFEKEKLSTTTWLSNFSSKDLLGAEIDLVTVEALKPRIKDAIWKEVVPIRDHIFYYVDDIF